MRLHSGFKPYGCDSCSARFTQFVHLKLHKRLHSNERPFICGQCAKSYISASGLRTHWKTTACRPTKEERDFANAHNNKTDDGKDRENILFLSNSCLLLMLFFPDPDSPVSLLSSLPPPSLPSTPGAAVAPNSHHLHHIEEEEDEEDEEDPRHPRPITPPADHRQVIVTPLLDCPAELASSVLNDPAGRKITVVPQQQQHPPQHPPHPPVSSVATTVAAAVAAAAAARVSIST